MQDQNSAAVADRFMLRAVATGNGNPNSMQNLNTNLLADGAMCFVSGSATMYYLDKAATTGGITPSSGPGQWKIFQIAEGASGVALLGSTAYNAFPVDGSWGTSTDSGFILDTVSDSTFALTALGGVLTYSGVTRKFLVTLTASVEVGDVSTPRDVFLGIAKNNDLLGAPTGGTSGEIDEVISIASSPQVMSTCRVISLASGDTVRAKMAGPAAATSLTAMIRMAVTPA